MALPSATLSYPGLQYLLPGSNYFNRTIDFIYFSYSLMLHRPLQFVDLTRLRTEKSHTAFHPSNMTGDLGLTNTSNPEARYVDTGHAGQILPPCLVIVLDKHMSHIF